MKKYLRFTSILLLMGLLSSCEEENTLLDTIHYEYLADENLLFLTTGSSIQAWMTGPQSAVGFGGGYAFETEDDFKNVFVQEADSFPSSAILYFDFKNIKYLKQNYNSDLEIKESQNYGQSFSSYKYLNKTEYSEGNYIGTHTFIKPFFFSFNQGIVVSRFELSYSYSQSGIRVYALDGHSANLQAEIKGSYMPVAVTFMGNNGWILAKTNDYSSYAESWIFKTSDGGFSWSEPILVSYYGQLADIIPIAYNKLIVKGDSQIFLTEDGGESWKNVTPVGFSKLGDIEIINENTFYLLAIQSADAYGTIANLLKTTNRAKRWDKVNEKPFYADEISFSDEVHGLAISNRVLQTTSNGGTHWRLRVIPILQ